MGVTFLPLAPMPLRHHSRQVSLLAASTMKDLKVDRFLAEMDAVVPWTAFAAEVAPFYTVAAVGRPRFDIELLLRIHVLQQCYDLSDPGAEEAIHDRLSFQRFLGIDPARDTVPDESTILHFRHLLEKHRLAERFFALVNASLAAKGLLLKVGSIVDATTLHAPPSTKNRAKARDPEMHQTKKGNQWYFGMKAHIAVDVQHGLVHHLVTTAANVHDRDVLSLLLHGTEQVLLGDSAYGKQEDKRAWRKEGKHFLVNDKASRSHPLSSSQRRRNRKKSGVRAKVEHPFRVLKRQFHQERTRYRGLFKNTQRLFTAFTLANLFRVRRLLPTLV
ncbi:MAG: IS5 family transposase ISEcret7 [Thermoanaerobaculia bacterium]|nr:IS5 family transposase ISEcret7 [Thermoanaerobaculia bacterium]